ncbi:MAG: sigma 54-interacting transcriptional regulator [Gemmatimonadaceae bacterium]
MTPLEQQGQLLVDVWRTASPSAPLSDTLPRLAAILARVIPADYILVRHLDVSARRLETVAVGAIRPCALPAATRDVLADDDFRAFMDWCRASSASLASNGMNPSLVRLAVPPSVYTGGELLLAPLRSGDVPLGAIAIVARLRGRLSDAHVALASELIAPLAAALENDLRLKEFSRMREALEADKRALLQRLERQELADAIVGRESGLQHVMERVDQVAPTDVPVLLLGETGTGKEVVARAIHAKSRRAGGPILRVNCGALASGLLDSELFGHEKGSFTGAVAMRKGWFERADGGTLFLDEIAELPLDAQVRLLRIVQDGTFERVGGQRSHSVDVRVVAATHRNLRDMVARGGFREDLWYRIGVFPIEIPPLRARREDIPALAAHFALRAGMRLGGAPLALGPDDVDLLVAYAWPGNVRELAAVIERAAILGDGRQLRLAAALGGSNGSVSPPVRAGVALKDVDRASVVTLDEAMTEHIERALSATGGRIEGPRGAAALLHINPHTLRARMRKLRIDWTRFRPAQTGGYANDPHWE